MIETYKPWPEHADVRARGDRLVDGELTAANGGWQYYSARALLGGPVRTSRGNTCTLIGVLDNQVGTCRLILRDDIGRSWSSDGPADELRLVASLTDEVRHNAACEWGCD